MKNIIVSLIAIIGFNSFSCAAEQDVLLTVQNSINQEVSARIHAIGYDQYGRYQGVATRECIHKIQPGKSYTLDCVNLEPQYKYDDGRFFRNRPMTVTFKTIVTIGNDSLADKYLELQTTGRGKTVDVVFDAETQAYKLNSF